MPGFKKRWKHSSEYFSDFQEIVSFKEYFDVNNKDKLIDIEIGFFKDEKAFNDGAAPLEILTITLMPKLYDKYFRGKNFHRYFINALESGIKESEDFFKE